MAKYIYIPNNGGFAMVRAEIETTSEDPLSEAEELITKLYRQNLYLMKAMRNKFVCPCTIADEPCHPNCTCKNSMSSHGCSVCAGYGSDEQRKSAANRIVNQCK